MLGRQASNNRKLKTKKNSNYSKMISEDSLPTKSRSLRAKSIAKRLATEKNQSDVKQGGRKSSSNFKASAKRSSSSSSKHHTMSKYRRKVANAKGQLISKCPFGVFKICQKTNNFFSLIFALASKKRVNQKSSVRESR